jgi:hypothetical protein
MLIDDSSKKDSNDYETALNADVKTEDMISQGTANNNLDKLWRLVRVMCPLEAKYLSELINTALSDTGL